MSLAYILLAEENSNEGRLEQLNVTVHINQKSKENHIDTILAPGLSSSLYTFAKDALFFSRFHLEQIADISAVLDRAVITVILGISREVSIDEDQSRSAGLLLFIAIAAKIFERAMGRELPFSFAATGDLSKNDHSVQKVSLLVPKLKAAAKGLSAGDKVFFPSANLSDTTELRAKLQAKEIELIAITTLEEGLEQLLGIDFPANGLEDLRLKNDEVEELSDVPGRKYQYETSLWGRFRLKYIYVAALAFFIIFLFGKDFLKKDGVMENTAILNITTQPAGAILTINDKEIGPTSRNVTLEPGIYNFLISKQGFSPWQQSVRIHAGKDTAINVMLKPLIKLTLGSDLRADILLDEKVVRKNTLGPVEISVPEGTYEISFARSLFDTVSFTIPVSDESPSEYICKHKRTIIINSNTESGSYQAALIKVNGKNYTPKTYTNNSIILEPGLYEITVYRSGFNTVEVITNYKVEPKLIINEDTLSFTLKPTNEKRRY